MKHLLLPLFYFVLTLLSSCSNNENNALLRKLDDIKTMGDTLPRKAIQCLDSIKPLFVEETEYMQNKLALLEIRLRDKAYIMHTSADTIKKLSSFFDKHGSAKEKQEAYYYMGSVYRDLNDYPSAITAFLKAAFIAENNDAVDNYIHESTYSQLSHLYNAQFNYSEALNMALNGLYISEKSGSADARTYMTVATSFFEIQDTMQSIKYANIALKLIEKNGVSNSNADILASALGKFTLAGCKSSADNCFKMLKRLPEQSMPFNYLENLAIYRQYFVSIDSTALARLELYNTTDMIESKYDAARWLTLYYAYKKDYKEATTWAVNFIDANSIVIEKRQFEHTTNANNFFQYQRDKEEEMAIMHKASCDRQNLFVTISLSVIFLLVGVVFYFYRKKRLLDIILSKENNIREVRTLIEKKERELEAEKATVDKKQRELERVTATNDSLSKQLADADGDFKMLIAQNRELTRLTLMSNISENAKEIVDKVKKAAQGKYRLNDAEWKELLGAVDNLYPEFTYEVQSKFKRINEPMLRVCYLLKIGLSGPEIVNLTDYPRQTVWDRIKRIEKIL